MKRLRDTDGTKTHRRAARYHQARCTTVKGPLHTALAQEMGETRKALVLKARAAEDAEDEVVSAEASVDGAEIALENVIRDVDAALAKMDRQNEGLGAQAAVFPNGFGDFIDPEEEEQIKVLETLRVHLKPFAADALLAPTLTALDTAEATLKTELASLSAAETNGAVAFAEELSSRAAVREQLESAYGRLRSFYKARPALAEGFFLKEGSRKRKAAASPANPPVSPPASPGGSPSTPA